MADWALPTTLSDYLTGVLPQLKDRDTDAGTLFLGTPSNIPTGSIRYNRSSDKFQEWDGAAWQDKVLSVAGGGTGGATQAAARTGLGLGSMAVQNNNAVNITGGSISGVAIDASQISTGILPLARGGTGASLAIGAAGSFLRSSGAAVAFSTDGSQLTNLNGSNITTGTIPPAVLSSTVPSGGIIIWPTNSIPSGYLLCNGQAVSRATFATLFAVISTLYGVGDGSTTFNVPNLVNRFPLGAGTYSITTPGGALGHNHTVTVGSHTHTFSGTTGQANNVQTVRGDAPPSAAPASNIHGHSFSGGTDAGGGFSVNSTGADPPFLALNFLIKT